MKDTYHQYTRGNMTESEELADEFHKLAHSTDDRDTIRAWLEKAVAERQDAVAGALIGYDSFMQVLSEYTASRAPWYLDSQEEE